MSTTGGNTDLPSNPVGFTTHDLKAVGSEWRRVTRRHAILFPRSYAVRADTLEAVFVDLTSAIGEQGFRWVFLVHRHGAR